MKSAALFLFLLPFLAQSALAQDPSRWECICQGRPCACKPLPEVNPQLCDIICPPNTRYTRSCSCEMMTPNEREQAKQQDLERREKAKTVPGK